jgi:hypothetical protein
VLRLRFVRTRPPYSGMEGNTLSKLRKHLPFKLVDVKRAEEVRRIRERGQANIRRHAAMGVLFFTAYPLGYVYLEFTDPGRPSIFSSHAIPLWIALLVVTPMCIAAVVLAVMSVVGNGEEWRKHRRCLWAFMLTFAGIVILLASSS